MNTDILEKIKELPEHVQEEVADFIEFLHQKYVEQAEEQPARTPEGEVIIGYDVDGTPLYASQAKEEFRKRLEAMDQGEYITIEQLREEVKKW